MSLTRYIAIVELESHNEVLRAYLLVLLEMDYKILCLTTPFNYEQLVDLKDSRKINFVLKEKSDSYEKFFSKNKERLSVCDISIITTIPLRNPFFQSYLFPCKTIFVVHKYHSYFDPSNNVKLSGLKDIGRMIKGKLAGYSKMYLRAISNFSAIVMPSYPSYKYANEHNVHGPHKLIGYLDFAINEFISIKQKDNIVQIVIPGTIGIKSRDYKPLIDAVKTIKNQIQVPIQFHLLGRPMGAYGDEVIAQCKNLESTQIQFSFYQEFIHQSKFDEVMMKADFLILPIAEQMKFDIYQEKNGYSCVSGNINDMLKYGLPSILPSYYPLDKNLEKMISRYKNSNELGDILLKWIETKKYNEIKESSEVILIPYRPNAMSGKFGRVLEQLV